MRPIAELDAMSARLEARLEGLHRREAELGKSESAFDRLRALEAHVDLAHVTKQRLEVDAEREAARAEELRQRVALDAAHKQVGEKATAPKAAAELARAESDHWALEAAARGMAAVVAERSAAWEKYRAEQADAIGTELGAEAVALEADMRAWVAALSPLAERWAALNRRWSSLTRSNYRPGATEGGPPNPFPLALEGRPTLVHPARFLSASERLAADEAA